MVPEHENRPAGDYESLYRSYLALRKEVDHLSALRLIALSVSASLDLDTILRDIAEAVQSQLEVSRLMIYLMDRDGVTARPVIARYGRDTIERERLAEETETLEGSPMLAAVQRRQVVYINTAYQRTAFIPLVAKDTTVGVMRLDDPLHGGPFAADDIPLFQDLGAPIAVAINNAQLYALAVTDGLTGLYVRRYFDLKMEEEMEKAARYARKFSLLLCDIDHFKKFNDTHGHQTGDMVLQQFAELLRKHTRKSDVCCRYGGEEMAIILPETGLEDATVLAEKLCLRIRTHLFIGMEKKELHVTSSIGVAEHRPAFQAPADMVRAADEALYRAKQNGRNRVEVAAT